MKKSKVISFLLRKIIMVGLVLIVCISYSACFDFLACTDYGYTFEFSVVGGNGSLSAEGNSSPVTILGGKKASEKYPYKVEFTAVPDNGYHVKEWTLNSEAIEDNKTNSFTAIITEHTKDTFIVTVEFELIPKA